MFCAFLFSEFLKLKFVFSMFSASKIRRPVHKNKDFYLVLFAGDGA